MCWIMNNMKKLVIVLVVILLSACKATDEIEQVEEFEFDGETYTYSETTSQGYDQFTGSGHLIEVNCNEECIISFELDEDIYIVTGTTDTWKISKNGTTILIDGLTQTPTGTEVPEWNDDIFDIIAAYKK